MMKTKRVQRIAFRPLVLAVFFCSLMVALLAGGTTVAYAAETVVQTADELKAVVDDLNANGGSATVRLGADLQQSVGLKKGELTILGEGHKLTSSISVIGEATLNLGSASYGNTLDIRNENYTDATINLDRKGTLNLYNGVTITWCKPEGSTDSSEGPAGQPASGVLATGTSTFNMYGGTITDCKHSWGTGGVYLDGNAHFNMKGGTITNCIGMSGGAVGFAYGSAIGPNPEGSTAFHMTGGTISNCISQGNRSYGGGALYAYTASPVSIVIDGGTITDCSADGPRYRYGGAVFFYCTDPSSKLEMNGGTITDCSAKFGGGICLYSGAMELNAGTINGCDATYGGGVFLIAGKTVVADGFGLHNNVASGAGDDIYNNGATVTLGTVDTTATLKSCGDAITGWYEDAEERWSSPSCGSGDHLVLFGKTGVETDDEFGLKAAHGLPEHTVTFDSAGGTDVASQKVTYGETAKRPEDPTREGYTFVTWLDEDDAQFDFATPIKGNRTLTAQWKPNDSKITYDANGGEGKTSDTVGKTDDVVKVAESGFSREGYTFVGWNTAADGSGEAYQPGDEFTLPPNGATLYAQWEASVYTIIFDPNGGEVEGSVKPVSTDYEWGTKITIPEAEREGYELLFWKGSEYQPGDEYTVTEDHTFVAQWEKVEEQEEPSEPEPTEPGKQEPTKPSQPAKPANPAPKKEIPQTGDPVATMPLAALVGVGLGILPAGVVVRRKKR